MLPWGSLPFPQNAPQTTLRLCTGGGGEWQPRKGEASEEEGELAELALPPPQQRHIFSPEILGFPLASPPHVESD